MRVVRPARGAESSAVTDGSSTQVTLANAEKRAQKEEEARARGRRSSAVTDYVHLDLPDMRLDTLPHVRPSTAS